MDEKIEIITKYHNKPPRADGKKPGVDYVERTVTINGKIMYTDRIDVQMYKAGDDPVSRFRNWLYGRNRHCAKLSATCQSEVQVANATPSISERVGEIALSYLERCLRTTPTVSPNSPQKSV